jgi:predicted RecB family nuclease
MKLLNNDIQLSATDLSNHLYCHHLTELNRLVAHDQLSRPYRNDPALEVLAQRGREHEAAYIEYLKKKNLTTVNLQGKPLQATIEAMAQGIDVLIQPRLENNQWMGLADILLKVEGKSKFGNYAYEVQDTKLAQNTRTGTLLQLCLYTDLLTALQDSAPLKMYVVKPGENFPTEEYFYSDFQAYYRLSKSGYEKIMATPDVQTYPEAVEHCGICNWWSYCDKRRHDDDHLSLIAGIRNTQILEAQKQNLITLQKFAEAESLAAPERGNKESFLKKQSQAKVQLDGRRQDKLLYKLLPIEPGRGLHRLPEPNKGDIYFDIEGDAFFPEGGLEYLLGYAFTDKAGNLTYSKHWAITRLEEKQAFEKFMAFVANRWKQNPKLYIYHFSPYEPSAIKRLARVHATFEKEVDELLRADRFIDLHAVFKEALLASVERYSLKDLEKFTKYIRLADLHEASKARKILECALELNEFNSLPAETLSIVEQYNADDCLATEALHQWLEKLRSDLTKEGKEFQRPVPGDALANEKIQQMDIRSQALFNALTKGLPEDKTLWTREHHAKWLIAHQIDYFRREDKSAWWEYYRVHEMEYEDLVDERKALTGLQYLEVLPLKPREKTVTHRYRFQPQETTIHDGDEVHEVKGEKAGTVQQISMIDNTIDIKKTAKTVDIHPKAIHVFERIDPGSLATSLMNLADAIDEFGLAHTWPYHASKDLLMRRKPKLLDGTEGVALLPNEDPVTGAIRLALNLDKSILPIQGPPGTGKTYTGAKMIIALVKAKKKVGITAISHSVIRTLFEKVKTLCNEEQLNIEFVHKITDKSETPIPYITEVTESKKALAALDEGKIVGGTAWLWADDNSRETLDYLFIDEAGQMSLSHALAASRAAKNLVLLGDPQQLEQPQKGSHPEGSDVAALTYLLEGHPTMPESKGLFLAVTRRLHPDIARFTSEIFYEARLQSLPGLERQAIGGGTPFDGSGLFYVPVHHQGNQSKSPEEIDAIAHIVEQLLSVGTYTNAKGEKQPLKREDILIVAPYNAQVAALTEKLPGMPIGTVDKFQGKEAPVVIYSMTSSTVNDAPRGMNFLFSPNRLNVATSRAKCVCILVASPMLLEPACNTISQMKWSNALCRYVELTDSRFKNQDSRFKI